MTDEERTIAIAERVAILIHDAGYSEEKAERVATALVDLEEEREPTSTRSRSTPAARRQSA